MAIKIRKKDLIGLIQETEPFKDPKADLEQYTIDPVTAVDLIFIAGFEFNDIEDTIVFDLGCGTGRLSIASAFMKAHIVISIDLDFEALSLLKKNVSNVQLSHIIYPVCTDISSFELSNQLIPKGMHITSIMNPPFGVQKKRADRAFLDKAFQFSDVIYSIHARSKKVQAFIRKFVKDYKWKIDQIIPFTMVLERSFPFHSEKRKTIYVDIYRFTRENIYE